jgi:NAD(P)H-dependent FMN reductase
MSKPKILAFSGSVRRESVNLKLLRQAISSAEEQGAEVDYWDLKQKPFPMYDGDLEEENGLPGLVREFKRKVEAADGVLMASPEYNAGPTPLLKNTIDWASRPDPQKELRGNVWSGATVGLMGASPSTFGSVRSSQSVQITLINLGVRLVTPVVTVPDAYNGFQDEEMVNEPAKKNLQSMVANLIEAVR